MSKPSPVKPIFTVRTPEVVLAEVRFQVANHTGKKKSHVTAKTRLTHLDGDGIFDVMSIMCDVFGIEEPSDEITEEFVEGNVQALVDFIMRAPMQKIKPNKVADKSKKAAQKPKAQKKSNLRYPEVETPTVMNLDGMANEIADRAAETISSGRNWVFSYIDNELQMRHPKTDEIFAVVTIVVDAMQVGFRVVHFQEPSAASWDVAVVFASWSLGTPYTIAKRFDMARQLRLEDRPDSLDVWVIETVAKRVQFLPLIAPLFKKLIGKAAANGVNIVSEIGGHMGIEIEDEVFDVYTNLNKLEVGDEEAMEISLDSFFTQNIHMDFASDNSSPKACVKVCKPTATPDEEDEDEGAELEEALDDVRNGFELFDKLNTLTSPVLADLFIEAFDKPTYMALLIHGDGTPVSQVRSKMLDALVFDYDLADLARVARQSKVDAVKQFGHFLKANA